MCGIKIIDSLLITNILVSIISSILMYKLVLELTKDKKVAFIGGLIYMLLPYRLGLITVRMALAENFAGIFIPLILLSIYYLLKGENKKFYISFIIGYTGLILSHYIIAMYFSIFVFIILLFYVDKLIKEKRVLKLILATIAVILLVLPNITIFIEHYGMDYLISADGYVTRPSLIEENILEPTDLIIPKENYDWTPPPHYIYAPVILLAVSSLTLIVIKNKRFGLLTIALIVTCLILILCQGIWKILPKITYNIQFPWRLLLILSSFLAIVSPMLLCKFNKKWIFTVCIIICIVPSLFLIQKLSTRIYTKDHSIPELERGVGNMGEYYPSAYYYIGKEYYKNKTEIDIIEGTGEVKIIENTPNELKFKIENSQNLKIELPKIYYKGYKLTEENKREKQELLCGKTYGLIQTNVKDGTYTLKYQGTLLYNITTILRIIAILTIAIYSLRILKQNTKKAKKQ